MSAFSSRHLQLAEQLLERARANKVLLATAESCTGGLIAALLTEIPGSSDVFERGFVTYSNCAKVDLLRIPEELITELGAVSEPVARRMAEGAIELSRAQAAVAVTGIAGPGGGTADKPVGLVHIAAARKGAETLHERRVFGDVGRSAIRMASVEAALGLLLRLL
jgi:nicotinamide-nucleotide amidase